MKIPSLIISAGKGCFTQCKGCYQYFGKNMFSTNEILKFVKKYKEKYCVEKVTLAGGDPLTRPDIVYLIDELIKMNIEISVDTTGKPFLKATKILFNDKGIVPYMPPEFLKNKISVIGIALDGCTTQQINYFRRGITLSEIEQILQILTQNNFNICINTVVNQNNINDLKKIYEIIKKYPKIFKWQLFQFSPTGDLGYQNRSLYEIKYEDFVDKVTELILHVGHTDLKIEAKSNNYRKLNYLLINSDGKLWVPKYDMNSKTFSINDQNSDQLIIGTIYEENILDKIDSYFQSINIRNNEIELIKNY